MNTNLTGKQRLWASIGIAWMAFWLFAVAPWTSTRYRNLWPEFFIGGVIPVAFVLTAVWVIRGFRQDKISKDSAEKKSMHSTLTKQPEQPQGNESGGGQPTPQSLKEWAEEAKAKGAGTFRIGKPGKPQ